MAGDAGGARKDWDEIASVLRFDQNPRRGLMMLAAAALVVVAVVVVAAMSAQAGGGGCNAILSTQRYGCLGNLASQTGNALYCNRIGNAGMRESCIMSVAEGTGGVSACSAFPDGPQRMGCIENVSLSSGNPSICDALDGHNQSLCRYAAASRSNFSQISYCTGIREPGYGSLCTYQSYYRLALQTGNYSYCGELPPGQNSTLLYAMTIQDPSYQSTAYGPFVGFMNTTPQDFCYSSLDTGASSSGGACSRISNSTLRAACDEAAAPSNATFSVQNATAACAYANSTALRNLCYFGVYTEEAFSTGNESWCGLITNRSYMASCVVNLANYTGNVTYCSNLNDTASRQACIYEAQQGNGNYTGS